MQRFWRTHLATIGAQEIYERVLLREGPTAAGFRWNGPMGQRERFDLLLRVIDDPAAGPFHIQDLGCGVGALFDHIAHQPYLRQGRYTGYDRSKAMILVAKGRIVDPRVHFVRADRVKEPGDYTLISGTFNVKMHAPWADWWHHVRRSLQKAWAQSRRGLAFNLLNVVPVLFLLSSVFAHE